MIKSAPHGELVPAQETMPGSPKLEFEFVPHQNKPKAIYLRLGGERVAYRGKPNTPQAATWVSMKSGYRVEDNARRADQLAMGNRDLDLDYSEAAR